VKGESKNTLLTIGAANSKHAETKTSGVKITGILKQG
jgi:hypothetical protein